MYFFIIFVLLSLSNVYLVWLLIELIFLFFLLVVINIESKNIGLIIYFFFQRVASLILFVAILLSLDKIVFLFLSAKLGLFPFFYWIVIVSVKVGLIGNIFVLSLQKISVFWLLWLVLNVNFSFFYFIVYLRVFFVIFSLLLVSDLWLLLVYSSIANTGILSLGVYGRKFLFIVFLYLFIIFLIIYLLKSLDSYIELLLVVFLFLVVPPFILFFIKFYVFLRLDFFLKIGFLLSIFDVFVLLYYFRLIFIKFILLDVGIFIYLINLFVCFSILFFRNCVTMNVFY